MEKGKKMTETKKDRAQKIVEIYRHARIIGANQLTLATAIAFMSDKRVTTFHEEFMLLVKPDEDEICDDCGFEIAKGSGICTNMHCSTNE